MGDWILIASILAFLALVFAAGFVWGAVWRDARWRRLIRSVSVKRREGNS